MLPIAIFRFSPTEGPGYFAEWLARQGLGYRVIAIDAGDAVPEDISRFAGIGMMGGPMSVNDPLPWIELLCARLREAVERRIPIVGHCLGGQLLARALGATVGPARMPEIGWFDVAATDPVGREWIGDRDRFNAFHWHYEGFEIPAGARHILRSAAHACQGYVVDDLHLGLQCHVEMDAELVRTWCRIGARELPAHSLDGRQAAREICRDLPARIAAMQRVADALYNRWARGLSRDSGG